MIFPEKLHQISLSGLQTFLWYCQIDHTFYLHPTSPYFILKLYFETTLKEAGSEVNSNKTILQLFEYETILIFKLFYWFDYI